MCDNNHEQLFVYSFSLPIILVVGVLFYEKHYEISRMRIEYFEKWLYHSNTRRLFTQDAKKSNPRQKKKYRDFSINGNNDEHSAVGMSRDN